MAFTVIALLVGFVFGVLIRGSLLNLANHQFRVPYILVAAIALQAGVHLVPDTSGFFLVIGSYLLLLGFALANLSTAGMAIAAVGIAMNFTVIALNHGMPVRPRAIVAAHIARRDEFYRLTFTAKRHLEKPGHDRAMFLADIIPARFPGYPQVLSLGDVVISVGLAAMVAQLMKTDHGNVSAASGPLGQ